jgi:hypothetical protein
MAMYETKLIVLDAIKKQRRTHFTTLVTGVWKEIDRYKDARSNDKYICALGASLQQAQCDSISLGAITGSLARANLLTSLYTGPQVDVLADAIKELKNINKLGGGLKFVSTAAYTTTYPTSVVQPTYRSHEHCGSHSQLIQLAESVEKSIEGLKLTGFLQKSKV